MSSSSSSCVCICVRCAAATMQIIGSHCTAHRAISTAYHPTSHPSPYVFSKARSAPIRSSAQPSSSQLCRGSPSSSSFSSPYCFMRPFPLQQSLPSASCPCACALHGPRLPSQLKLVRLHADSGNGGCHPVICTPNSLQLTPSPSSTPLCFGHSCQTFPQTPALSCRTPTTHPRSFSTTQAWRPQPSCCPRRPSPFCPHRWRCAG